MLSGLAAAREKVTRRLEEATDIASTIAGRAESLLNEVDQRASVGLAGTPLAPKATAPSSSANLSATPYTLGGTARGGYLEYGEGTAAMVPPKTQPAGAPPDTPATPAAGSVRTAELAQMLEEALVRAEEAEDRLAASDRALAAERAAAVDASSGASAIAELRSELEARSAALAEARAELATLRSARELPGADREGSQSVVLAAVKAARAEAHAR